MTGFAAAVAFTALLAGPPRETGELLVKFRHGADRKAAHAKVKGKAVGRFRGDANLEEVKLPRGLERGRALGLYRKLAGVLYAEPNAPVTLTVTPNDPKYFRLWAWDRATQTYGPSDNDVDAPIAWGLTTGAKSVIFADIDTGVDYTHPDLAANMWRNRGEVAGNGVDDDGNGYVDDLYGYDTANNDGDPFDRLGHGTHTTGTVAGVGNNGVGITGAAWNVSVMAVKNFADPETVGDSAASIRAIDYATENGAKVINASWGSWAYAGGGGQAMRDAIARANAAGVLFVTSAANNGWDIDDPSNLGNRFFPCGYDLPNVICLANVDRFDQLATGSNWGAVSVDLAAPGTDIYSTFPVQRAIEMGKPEPYTVMGGTSMAAPHVAGLAVLLLSCNPFLTVAELRQRILGGVRPLPSLAGKTVTGGTVNYGKAFAGMVCAPGSGPTATPVPPVPTLTRTPIPLTATRTRTPTAIRTRTPTQIPSPVPTKCRPWWRCIW